MGLVLAALTTLFASAVTLTVPTAGASDCPSPRQVSEALNALAPGLVTMAPASGLTGAGALRLSVSALIDNGELRVDLADAQGELVLHRILPASPRRHEPDCTALAQTVALIVDRYLHDVGYEAPPLAPPPKPTPPPAPVAPVPQVVVAAAPAPPQTIRPPRALWRLGVAGTGRLGDVGGFDGDATLALDRGGAGEQTRLGLRLSGGLAAGARAQWMTDHGVGQASNQTAALRRLPLRLGAYLGVPAGPGQLEPGLGAGADVLLVSAGARGTPAGRHLAPFGDVALGYSILRFRPVYFRMLSRIALSLPYDFNTLAGAQVWRTPRAYTELSVELGLAFL